MLKTKYPLRYGIYKLNNFLMKKCHKNMLKSIMDGIESGHHF